MGNYKTFVAMDVHARSVTAKAMVKETAESATMKFGVGYTAADIAKWAEEFGGPILFAYESGCTGFWLARDLQALGHDCEVIAVSTLAKTQKQKKGKCDKLDASMILSEMMNPASSYSCVFIPDEKTEGERDLCRLEQSLAEHVKEARQALSSFLMRHGYVWNEKTASGGVKKRTGRSYKAWLDSISFDDWATNKTFCMLRKNLVSAQDDLKEVKKLVVEMAQSPENKPYTEALSQIKGVSINCAMALKAEFGVFSRFKNGRSVSSYIGVVPSNTSSGDKEIHGHITKCGNKYIRRRLTEGLAGITHWSTTSNVSITSDVSPSVVARAQECNKRIIDRYNHFAYDSRKNPNKARVAVMNELVRWIWVIGCEVEQEQAAKLS